MLIIAWCHPVCKSEHLNVQGKRIYVEKDALDFEALPVLLLYIAEDYNHASVWVGSI